jgi:hypothetical protein
MMILSALKTVSPTANKVQNYTIMARIFVGYGMRASPDTNTRYSEVLL